MRETVCHVYVLSAFQYNALAEPSIWRVHNISRNCTRFNHYGLSAQKECSLFLNSETYYNRGRIILGDPGAVNWVRTNEGQSFQEQVREALGCDSYRTSLSTHSIIVSDWAQKNIFVLNQRPASIALLSLSSYTKEFTSKRHLECSPYLSGSCRRTLFQKSFQWKWDQKTEEIP